MRIPAALLLISTAAVAQAPSGLSQILARVSEEAEVLQQNAPKTLTQETLEQRSLLPPSRFRPREGQLAVQSTKPRIQVRQIVSEYSVGALRQSETGNLVEFRQVVSVDGRQIQSSRDARHALSLGVHSPDDRLRKRMLEDFAKNGLVDVATDYAMILLAFNKRGLAQMKVVPLAESRMGADEALVLAWAQTNADSGVLEFRGRQVTRRALRGTLWVRRSDGLPLRVQALSDFIQSKHRIQDEATVDYMQSAHGFVTPVSVVHRHVIDGQLITENFYRYEPFKLFSADADIKFTEVPDPATLPAPTKK